MIFLKNRMCTLAVLVIFATLLIFGVGMFKKDFVKKYTDTSTLEQKTLLKSAIFEYLKNNISRLSPEKEVLGGTFYITELIVIDNEHATVFYEDGHNAYAAEILFYLDENERIVVKEFTIIK